MVALPPTSLNRANAIRSSIRLLAPVQHVKGQAGYCMRSTSTRTKSMPIMFYQVVQLDGQLYQRVFPFDVSALPLPHFPILRHPRPSLDPL